jgi:hypothetical protein
MAIEEARLEVKKEVGKKKRIKKSVGAKRCSVVKGTL